MGEPEEKPAREKTDEGLQSERVKTDRALAHKPAPPEVQAAAARVESAREQTDAVVDFAREKTDHKLDHAEPDAAVRAAVERERALHDAVLQRERAAADAALLLERERQASQLADQLPRERAKTDRYLMHERARADDALAHRDDFLGMVSHDLRNMLNGVLLHASELAESPPHTEEGRRAIASAEGVVRYVERMRKLLGDLVDVASLDAGKLVITPHPCDAAALVRDSAKAFTLLAQAKGVALRCELPPEPIPARLDSIRVLQVLTNLVSNAVKFTPPGGEVVARAERAQTRLVVLVRDTGPGIPPALHEAVFERFWQVGKADRRGVGLGLYIAKSIVVAHGGELELESTVGRGSTFRVALPLRPA
jgi:signal transduction histidine kinase